MAAAAVTLYIAISTAEGNAPLRAPVPIVRVWQRVARRRPRPTRRYLSLLNA